jgi:hypothetical protein
MKNYKEVSQFISCGLKDAVEGSTAQSMRIHFNNTAITNVSSDTPTVFEPILLTLDWAYSNITDRLRNNKLRLTTAANKFHSTQTAAGVSQVDITIPSDRYDGFNLALKLKELLNENVNWRQTNGTKYTCNWLVEYDGAMNVFKIAFTREYLPVQGGQAEKTGIKIVHKFDDIDGATNLWGFDPKTSDYTIAEAQPFDSQTGLLDNSVNALPFSADLKIYDVINLHSNIAKRFLQKSGGSLSNTDVLLQILIPNNYGNGSQTILIDFSASSDLWKQNVHSNFDFITFELRDTRGILIDLDPDSDFNITFKITRYIEELSKEDRIYNMSQYQKLGQI